MKPYVGEFFVVTPNSEYQVRVGEQLNDLCLRKVASRGGLVRGRACVGDELRGMFLDITGRGLFKSRKVKNSGPRTGVPVGFFFSREQADVCFEARSGQAFDPRWQDSTRKVLSAIGIEHPFISVCVQGEFAVPTHVFALSPP